MNTQQLSSIVATISNSNLVVGMPGSWSLSTAASLPAGSRSQAVIAAAPASTLLPGQVALAQAALSKSNAAAQVSPSATSANPVGASTPSGTIQSWLQDLNVVAAIGADISTMEQHGKVKLHWWGWEATWDEQGTKALEHLLATDMKDFTAVTAALATISPVLAAISGIISIVSGALASQISGADAGNGIVLHGYLWVGVDVKAA